MHLIKAVFRSPTFLPCWMDPNTLFVTTFVVPVSVIVVVNLSTLAIAVVKVCRISPRFEFRKKSRYLVRLACVRHHIIY